MTRDEQDLPTLNDSDSCQETIVPLFTKMLRDSLDRGVETYGTALQPFNGRSAIRDVFEEVFDSFIYLEQIRREHEVLTELLKESRKWAQTTQNLQLFRKIDSALTGLGLTNE